MHAHWGSSLSLRSSHGHVHDSCALCALLLISSISPFTSSPSSSSLWSPCCSYCPTPSTSLMSWINTLRTSADDLGTLAENEPPTAYEPNDHFITEADVEYTQESLSDQRFPDDFDYDDVTIGQTLLDACRRRADHSEEEGLSSCLSSSVSHDRTGRPVVCRLVSSAQETQRHNSEMRMSKLALSWSDKESRFSCSSRRRTTPTRSTTSFHIRHNCEEKIGRRLRYYPWTHWQDTGIAKWSLLYEWLERFSRCWISTQWTFPRYQSTNVSFPPHPVPGGMLSRSMGMPSRRDGPPSIWDTHGISRNVFANPTASSSAPYPQELNPWSSHISEPIYSSQAGKNENQTPVQDQRCQSGPSARNSVIPSEGDSWKNYGADQHRLHISDHHFDKFTTPATFACWKIRFKTEVCTCSQFPTEAMLWINEVEMVDSVDDLKSSLTVRGIRMPDFEVLDVKIASALNRIIHNSHFKRRISLEEKKAQKEDRFLRGRQIAYLIYEYFRVIGIHDSVENYADLFTISLRNDDIQEFDSKWDGILLSMTKIPPDDILEGLYKLRIRDSEKLKTGL